MDRPSDVVHQCMMMLDDVPGDHLVEKITNLKRWYLELQSVERAYYHSRVYRDPIDWSFMPDKADKPATAEVSNSSGVREGKS